MNKRISIKIGEPQPLPCPKCNRSFGYQYSDLFRMYYTSIHNPDGTNLNRSKTVYCASCGAKLPFTLMREDREQVE